MKYARAKEQQAEYLGDQIISISDQCKPDTKFAIEKAKLQVDARKFVASKLKPKKWGENPDKYLETAKEDAAKTTNESVMERVTRIIGLAKNKKTSDNK
jgi:hypothetical protein